MPAATASPPTVCSLLREAALTAGAGAVVVLFCLVLLAQDRGFFWTDDYQTYQLAGYCDVARAWRAGEPPLLSSSSWCGGALAAEYQDGVFSLFLTACVLLVFSLPLPLCLAAAALSIVHLAVLAMGAFRLGRCRGLSADLALLVALVSALSGYTFIWGATAWFPALAGFAWVPWFWWSLERTQRPGTRSPLRPGIFLYLVITAGWPFAVLMTGVLTVWWVVRACCASRELPPLGHVLGAWGIGLGLSAPAWLMLIEFAPTTMRGQTAPLAFSWDWAVPLHSLPALLFPTSVLSWSVFPFWKPHLSVELAGGLVPVVILAAVVKTRRLDVLRTLRWEGALCGGTLLLVLSPGVGNFQYPFRWLSLFFVALALLAAHALALLRVPQAASLPNLGKLAVVLVLPVWAWALWLNLDPSRTTMLVGLGYLALLLAWALIDARRPLTCHVRTAMPCAVLLGTCWLTYATFAPFREVSERSFRQAMNQPQPLDPTVRYFSAHTWDDMGHSGNLAGGDGSTGSRQELAIGNSAMYYGVEFVNGYSPLMPAGLYQLFAFSTMQGASSDLGAERILTQETGPDGLLALYAVDGLVVSDRLLVHEPALAAHGWYPAARVEGGMVFHRSGPASPRVRTVDAVERLADREAAHQLLTQPRQGPIPLVLLGPSGSTATEELRFRLARVTLVRETRQTAVATVDGVSSERETLVVFSRPWYPGYQAFCDGQPVPVELLDLTLPAVRLPPGMAGEVVLEYRPRGLTRGLFLAAVTGVGVVLLLLRGALQHLRRRRPGSAVKG